MTQEQTYHLADQLLLEYRAVLGEDFIRYRNHVFRVLNNCLSLDQHAEYYECYAVAAVLHDIGIWTAHTIDYLGPSVEQATRCITRLRLAVNTEEIKAMILWHHKLSPYTGFYAQTVEIFRKADWIDVSCNMFTFGLKRPLLKKMKLAYPYKGFHRMLLKAILRNWLKHPAKPLPMFRR